MLGILAEEPKTKFFLATDCPKTEELFTRMFCERVMKYDKRVCRNVTSGLVKDRARVEGVQDALFDMLLLARTKKVLGSAGSTFGRMAEYWHGEFEKLQVVEKAIW